MGKKKIGTSKMGSKVKVRKEKGQGQGWKFRNNGGTREICLFLLERKKNFALKDSIRPSSSCQYISQGCFSTEHGFGWLSKVQPPKSPQWKSTNTQRKHLKVASVLSTRHGNCRMVITR